jgi:hypothetical protein
MVKPTSMVDEAVAEKASDFAKCKCAAAASQCPTPQQGDVEVAGLVDSQPAAGE